MFAPKATISVFVHSEAPFLPIKIIVRQENRKGQLVERVYHGGLRKYPKYVILISW